MASNASSLEDYYGGEDPRAFYTAHNVGQHEFLEEIEDILFPDVEKPIVSADFGRNAGPVCLLYQQLVIRMNDDSAETELRYQALIDRILPEGLDVTDVLDCRRIGRMFCAGIISLHLEDMIREGKMTNLPQDVLETLRRKISFEIEIGPRPPAVCSTQLAQILGLGKS